MFIKKVHSSKYVKSIFIYMIVKYGQFYGSRVTWTLVKSEAKTVIHVDEGPHATLNRDNK